MVLTWNDCSISSSGISRMAPAPTVNGGLGWGAQPLTDTAVASVVHQNVNPTLLLDDEPDSVVHRRVAEHIERQSLDAGAEAVHLGHLPRRRVYPAPAACELLGTGGVAE
jgi:hypothetical protein